MEIGSKKPGIAAACAPVNNPPSPQADQPRIWSLTQANSCMLGEQSLLLSCIPDRQRDDAGNFLRLVVHPVAGDIQHHPQVARKCRTFEYRACERVDGTTGLVYRMVSVPGLPPNSWLISAESVMSSLTKTWGYVESDRDADLYRFHRLNIMRPKPVTFPDVNELADELLTDLVIDCMDHPVLRRLLGPAAPTSQPSSNAFEENTQAEEDDSIYD